MNLLTIQAGIQEVQASTQHVTSGHNTSTFVFWGVMIALTFLFFFFLKRTDKIVEERVKREKEELNAKVTVPYQDPTDEIAAAIGLAISTYKLQMAELESLSLTIQKVSKQYSPWSSKIYTLRQMPK
jgi:hypothetical protein